MTNKTLFGHVAESFSTQIENLATESLAYIIRRTKIAKKAFLEFIEQVGFSFDADLTIHTQPHDDDKGFPDIVGINKLGKTVLIIESKFWAGLTGHQPASYLKKFPRKNKALLLFLAPRLRLPSLWSEIIRLCLKEGYRISGKKNLNSEFLKATVTRNLHIAITSWSALLTYIQRALETESLLEAASDVKQFIGLCEGQDTEAFLPLRPEELSPQIGRRVYQYNLIAQKVVKHLDAEKILVRKNLLTTSSLGEYGWYRRIGRYICSLEFNADYWGQYRETPLWFFVKELRRKNRKINNVKLRESLKSLERENPPRLLEDGEWIIIPLILPTNVEENQVISSLVKQVKDIARMVKK